MRLVNQTTWQGLLIFYWKSETRYPPPPFHDPPPSLWVRKKSGHTQLWQYVTPINNIRDDLYLGQVLSESFIGLFCTIQCLGAVVVSYNTGRWNHNLLWTNPAYVILLTFEGNLSLAGKWNGNFDELCTNYIVWMAEWRNCDWEIKELCTKRAAFFRRGACFHAYDTSFGFWLMLII